jgi:hypothetical protein
VYAATEQMKGKSEGGFAIDWDELPDRSMIYRTIEGAEHRTAELLPREYGNRSIWGGWR